MLQELQDHMLLHHLASASQVCSEELSEVCIENVYSEIMVLWVIMSVRSLIYYAGTLVWVDSVLQFFSPFSSL